MVQGNTGRGSHLALTGLCSCPAQIRNQTVVFPRRHKQECKWFCNGELAGRSQHGCCCAVCAVHGACAVLVLLCIVLALCWVCELAAHCHGTWPPTALCCRVAKATDRGHRARHARRLAAHPRWPAHAVVSWVSTLSRKLAIHWPPSAASQPCCPAPGR